ncbi:MAG: hypothetical protein PHG02_09825, partial [Oscillospiraceae bacterium]|nr:hypothetical protein [Oscillospiraceae bacterium]
MRQAKYNSFKYRIFGSNLMVALLPLLLCTLLMLNVFTNTLESQAKQAGEQQIQTLAEQLEATLQESNQALQSLAGNSLVQRALLDHTTDEFAKDVYLELYQATNGIASGA